MNPKKFLAQITSRILDTKKFLCAKLCPCNNQTSLSEIMQDISDEDIIKKTEEKKWVLLTNSEDIEWYQNNRNPIKPDDTTIIPMGKPGISDEDIFRKVEENNWILLNDPEEIEWYQNYHNIPVLLDENQVKVLAMLLHSAITYNNQLPEDCAQKDYINKNLLKSFNLLGLKVKNYSADDVKGFILKEDPLCNEPMMASPVIIKEQDDEVIIEGTVFVPIK